MTPRRAGPQQVTLDDLTHRDPGASPAVLRLDDGSRLLMADAATHAARSEILPTTVPGLAVVLVLREPPTHPEATT